MDLSAIKDWLVPASTAAGIVSAIVAAFMALRDYKLKLQAEARLADAAKVESDVKLLKLFVELMDIAHARGQSVLVSEKLFEALWAHMQKTGATNPKDAAIVTFPVGGAAQDAAIAAIATLGQKHAVLKPVAIRALESLASFKPDVATRLLQDLKREA
jgi:hypothetical protein